MLGAVVCGDDPDTDGMYNLCSVTAVVLASRPGSSSSAVLLAVDVSRLTRLVWNKLTIFSLTLSKAPLRENAGIVEEYALSVLWFDHEYALGAREATVSCTILDVTKRLYVSIATSTSDEHTRRKS